MPVKATTRPSSSSRRKELEEALQAAGSPERAKGSAWFFKTGKGDYGEGDRFLGIRVPVQRKIALSFRDLPLAQIARLLQSPWHECRFCALEILVANYQQSPSEEIYSFYLAHTSGVNNWDLVDTSAPYIVGAHLLSRERTVLDRLACSEVLWERRIAIVSTLTLIKNGELDDTYRIARRLLADRHDLTHKAVGWALRETGRKSRPLLTEFLRSNYTSLPRTTLRYAIEHFSPSDRKLILAGIFPTANGT